MDASISTPLSRVEQVLLVAVLFGSFCAVAAGNNSISTHPPNPSKLNPLCDGIQFTYVSALNKCCRVCPPGSGVTQPCTPDSNTECAPCPPGRYSPIADHEEGCHRCPFCQRNAHQVRACSAENPTECECNPGYYRNTPFPTCEKCSSCQHGFGAAAACTANRDTVCGRCRNGTFSDEFSLDAPCQPCLNCTNHQKMTKSCTLESNTVCEDSSEFWMEFWDGILIGFSIIGFAVMSGAVSGLLYFYVEKLIHRRRNKKIQKASTLVPTKKDAEAVKLIKPTDKKSPDVL